MKKTKGKQTGKQNAKVREQVRPGQETEREETAVRPGEARAPAAPEETAGPESLRDRWERMIRGEFRALYDRDRSELEARCRAETEALAARLREAEPVMELLRQRYGLEVEGMDALARALDGDEASWQSAADRAGLPVEEYRTRRALEGRLARYEAREAQARRQQALGAKYLGWMQEGDRLRETDYPSFDFRRESGDPVFRQLLDAGISVKTAYEALHPEELRRALTALAEPVPVPEEEPPFDVRRLTREEREELARRAARGERIAF